MSQNNKPTPKDESIMISDERGVELKNQLISEGRRTDLIDELLIKFVE